MGVSWTTNFDRDNESLIYRVYRDGNMTTPVYETTARSVVWDRQRIGFTDTGLAPGSSHTYRLRAVDAFGNMSIGNWTTLTAGTSGTLSAYNNALLPVASKYWPLGEASGTAVFDWASGDDATARAGVTRGVTGAISGDPGKASRFNGGTSGFVSSNTLQVPPNTFTVESWFKTSTTVGGKILGFGSSSSGNSSRYDRHIYMDNSVTPPLRGIPQGRCRPSVRRRRTTTTSGITWRLRSGRPAWHSTSTARSSRSGRM